MERAGLHTGLVTGNGVASTIKGLRADFNSILTLFSPISKEADKLLPNTKERIDVLIATDCISEGQNLQDCDYLINYDIHWNPVRIIQRFGRVDRIGSRNDVIQLVNYWPDIELDDYLRLKGRVEARMTGVNITGAGNSNVLLSDEEQADLDYRKSQLQRLQEEVVNLEDMDTGINIMDLGLNEFRMDLLAYMHEHPDIEHTPFGMSAVVHASEVVKPGVIFILKNSNNAVNIGRQNLLHPFYMVYLANLSSIIFRRNGCSTSCAFRARDGLNPSRNCAMLSTKRLPTDERCCIIVNCCKRRWALLWSRKRKATLKAFSLLARQPLL